MEIVYNILTMYAMGVLFALSTVLIFNERSTEYSIIAKMAFSWYYVIIEHIYIAAAPLKINYSIRLLFFIGTVMTTLLSLGNIYLVVILTVLIIIQIYSLIINYK